MSKSQDANTRRYDLEERTTEFAKHLVRLCKKLPRNAINNRLIAQAVSSGGSVGANYREANDALGKKDFKLRLRIARKEAKECMHWPEVLKEANDELTKLHQEFDDLMAEAGEFRSIFSSIIQKLD